MNELMNASNKQSINQPINQMNEWDSHHFVGKYRLLKNQDNCGKDTLLL